MGNTVPILIVEIASHRNAEEKEFAMVNQEIIDRIKAVIDHLTTLAEQYSWQSAAITGKDSEKVGPALMQMAINELLRAELLATALMRLGYRADSTEPPRERIPIGRDTEEMLELDKKAVTESIVLCEDVLAHHPEDVNMGCPVKELFEELRREEQKQLDLLEVLLDKCGTCAKESEH
jgi:bacterioferritin (cytochrome b1)